MSRRQRLRLGYGANGLTVVELPRPSHAGPELARSSLDFLRAVAATTTKGASAA